MADTKDINPVTGKPWGEVAEVAAAVEKQSINPVTGLQWGAISQNQTPGFDDYTNQSSRIATTESSLPYTDISKYTDYGVPLGRNLDWDEIRAQNQSTAEQWGRGLAKAGVTFTGALAENTVGVVAGLGSMLMGDPYRDNFVGKLVDESNEWMRENYANYYTREEQENVKVWSANFWADGVLNGLAYSAASIASVYATGGVGLVGLTGKGISLAGKLTGLAAKSAQMYKTAKAVTTGTKLGNILQKGSKVGTRSLNAFKMAEVGFYMGLAESSVEARETSKAALENLTEAYMQENDIFSMSDIPPEEMQRIKDTAEAAGNTNFALNLAITTGTNAFMFGKMALGYKGSIKSLKGLTYDNTKRKIIDTIEEKGLKKVVVDKLFGVSQNIVGEAVQEGSQYASNLYSLDIHTQKYKDTGVVDRVQAINSALTKTFGDKEGRESILIGAIIGGIMGGGNLFRPTDAQNEEKQRKLMQSQLQKIVDGGYFHDVQQKVEGENLAAILATKMEAALQAGNIKEFKDLQSDFILAKVSAIIKNGGLDVLLEQLDDTSSFTDEEFMKHFGFPLEDADGKPYKLEDHLGGESKSQFVEGLKNKVKDVKQVYDNVDDLFPLRQITKGLPALFMSKEKRAAEIATYNTRKMLRDQLMLSGYGIKDRNRRMKSMLNDLEDILKKDPIIDSLFGDALSTTLNEIKSLESAPFDEESLKDIEAAFIKREETLAALFESLEQGAGIANIETANKIKAIKEDYLEMSAENALALDIYNKLISDEFYRKTFEDNVKKAQEQTKAEEFAKQVENVIKNSKTSRELEDNRPNANDLSEEQKENLRLRKKQLEEQEAEAKAKYEEEIESMTPEQAVEYLKKAKKDKKTSATDIVGINAVLADLENNEGAQSAKEKIFPSSAQQASNEKSIKELDKQIARKKGVLKRSNLKEQTRKDVEEELKDLEAQRDALLANKASEPDTQGTAEEEVEVEDVDGAEDVNASDPEFEDNDSPDIGDRDTGPEFSGEPGVPDPQGKEEKDYSDAANNPELGIEDLKRLKEEKEEIKRQLDAAQKAAKRKTGKGVVIQESGESKNSKDNLRNLAEEYGIMPNKEHTVSELIGFIEKHGNYQTRLILSIIKKFAKKVGVSIRFEFDSEYTGIKGTSATYYPNTAAGSAEIVVKLSNLFAPATAARVLVHELVHAVTYELIDSVNKGETKFSPKQIEAAKRLKALLKTIKSDPDFKDSYGAKDEFELLAELTNPTFVKKLKNKFVNFIQKIYEYVADILGVKKSAYDEAVSILQDMVDFPEEANTITVEQARRYKEKQFLEDFNFTVEEYESLKNALGYDHSQMVDLLAKVVAVEEGDSLDAATAYVAFKLLGKESSKLRSELRYRVHGWSEFRARFDYHAREINEKFGYVKGQDVWKRMVLDRVVIDYLSETIVAYDANPKEFEKLVDKKWTQKDFTFIKKLWRALTGFLKKKGILKTPKKDMAILENISNQLAHEILNREYDVFDLQLEEGQIQKHYEETIATDPFAHKLVKFAQSIELILTGSLALRRAGSVYRTVKESLHDLDFVVKYSSIKTPENRKVLNKLRKIHAKYPRTKSRRSLEAASAESLEAIKDLDWYKEFLKEYPSYKPFSSFYGAEHNKYESFTVLGAVNGEYYKKAGFHKVTQADGTVKRKFHNKGDYIRGTGYQVDFFIRLQPNQDEHDNYFKLWKEVMIAKLKMGRSKDLTDWKYFIPFVKSQNSYNFYHPEWTYATGKSKRVGLGAKINRIEELQRQLEEKEKAIQDAEAQLEAKNPTPKAGTSSPSGMEKQNDAPFRTKIKNAYYAVLDKFGNADRMISGYGPVTIAKNPPLYEKDFESADSDILLPDTGLLLKSLGKSAEFRLGNGETWFIEEYGKEGLDLSSPEDYVDKFAYDVPIHIYIDNQFVGRLESGNITNLVERKSIIRDLAKGETVNRKVTRVVATNPNYSRTVNNETGEVQPIFLDPRKTFNYENLNIAAVSLDRGVWSMKTKNPEIDNELANQNINFDNLQPGAIAFIVDPKDTATGEVNFVKAQTRNLTKGVQKRIIEKLKDKEDENRLAEVAEVVANEAPKDSISETYLNFDQFGEDGSKFIVFKSPKLRRMVRVNEDELADSLNGIPAVQSLVFFNKDTERWQTDRRAKSPKSSKYNVGKDFINFLKNKKYQIDVQKANENLPYTNSIVELAPGSTYQDYLFNPIEDNEGPEVGHSSILRTDVQRIDGSIYHDLGVTFASGTRTKEAQSVMADVVDSTPKDQSDADIKIAKLEKKLRFKKNLSEEMKKKNEC